MDSNNVWRFDTKYYTADVKLEVWQTGVTCDKVEAIIFYFVNTDTFLNGTMPSLIKSLMDEY